jgi:PhnB protein
MGEKNQETVETRFAPMLIHKDGLSAIEFYKKAFGAKEIKRWSNGDGTIHVAEMSIGGADFFLREVAADAGQFSPSTIGGVTSIIELFVNDPYQVAARAIAAGAHELNPVRDYEETGFRQGIVIDPYGHRWSLLRKIPR